MTSICLILYFCIKNEFCIDQNSSLASPLKDMNYTCVNVNVPSHVPTQPNNSCSPIGGIRGTCQLRPSHHLKATTF